MTTLIHIVSEQTMQNLLPILALKPQRVVQVLSEAPEFDKGAKSLVMAVSAMREKVSEYVDLNPEFVEEKIPEQSPCLESTRKKICEILSRYSDAIVNPTGGTKPMAIGAYLASKEVRVPCLYCDTRLREFVSLGQCPLPQMPRFEDMAAKLTVQAVMAAHGVSPTNLKSDPVNEALKAVGRAGYEAYREDPERFSAFVESMRRHFRNERNRVPKSALKLAALCRKPIPVQEAWPTLLRFLKTLEAAGLLKQDERGNFLPAVNPERGEVEKLSNLLGGSWLELYVFDLLSQRKDLWADPHWSVEPRDPHEAAFGETDVVCVNVRHCALQVISCKMTLQNQLETLEALSQRRRDIGGAFAKAMLVVLKEEQGNERKRLENWANWLNVKVLMGDSVANAFSK